MYQQIRPLLFRLEPERAHNLTVALLRASGALPPVAALLRDAVPALVTRLRPSAPSA